jgi:hypothetical protein
MFNSRYFLRVDYNVYQRTLLERSANQKRHYLKSYNKIDGLSLLKSLYMTQQL